MAEKRWVGGSFSSAGGVTANNIARWDGSSWSALGGGVNGHVYALAGYDDGAGETLCAGGLFTSTLDSGDSYVARWGASGLDTTPPVITCPGDLTVEGTSPAGAVVSFSPTATDDCDPSPVVVGVPASGSTFPLGTTTVTCTATDGAGNSAMCTFDVTVEDTTAPTLACPPVVSVIDPKESPPGEVVFFSVMASDDVDPAPSVVCVPPSGSAFPRGTTLVTCTATDASGNQSICSFPVVVQPTTRRKTL